MPAGDPKHVDAYLAKLPADQRAALSRLRRQVKAAAPAAEEGMGYGLPGFYLGGPLLYYGAAKGHCAIYGRVPTEPAGLVRALAAYKPSKGTIRFAPDAPLPAALVQRLVKAKAAENQASTSRAPRARASAKRRASPARRRVAQVRRKR